MDVVQVKPDVYWVGAVDWNLRYFHGPTYYTHRGTTYNAYLVKDEKIALVDCVYEPFADELLENIRQLVNPADIDYIIVNHIEPDHSGALPKVAEAAPNAKIICSQKAKDGLNKYYGLDREYQVVKTGDEISLGSRTVKFILAPMLHWPDSMFSYIPEDKLLLPNDAFGQHYASSFRFNDQVDNHILMEEAAKYYANILLPFSKLVLKKLEEITQMGLEIDMIAPSHGIIWRQNPQQILDAYTRWAQGKAGNKAVIIYDTMWNSTQFMAKSILDGIIAEGIEAKLFKMSVSNTTEVIGEILDSKAILVGSSTFHGDYLPSLAPVLDELIGLKPSGRIGMAFGSYGWRSEGVPHLEKMMTNAGIELVHESIAVNWRPSEEELAKCREAGQAIGRMIKEGK